jgi:hypothetical protein
MGGFTVDPATLQAQASAIESGITSVLQECLAAAEQADGDENFQYGILLTPLAWPAMELVAKDAQEGIKAALQLSEALSEALNGVSRCYAGRDEGVCSALDKIAAEVEE